MTSLRLQTKIVFLALMGSLATVMLTSSVEAIVPDMPDYMHVELLDQAIQEKPIEAVRVSSIPVREVYTTPVAVKVRSSTITRVAVPEPEPEEVEVPEVTTAAPETQAEPEEVPLLTDVYWLAVLIYFEAGTDECTDRHQQLVAMVAINRTKYRCFRDTIKGVIEQTDILHGEVVNQYNPAYTANPPKEIPQRCFDNARIALEGKVECPANVIYQAEFEQGSATYATHTVSRSTTYFCYE